MSCTSQISNTAPFSQGPHMGFTDRKRGEGWAKVHGREWGAAVAQ